MTRWREQLRRAQALLRRPGEWPTYLARSLDGLERWLRETPKRLRTQRYRALLTVGAVVLVVVVLGVLLACFGAENVRNGSYVFGAPAVVVGLYYTARRIKASEDQVRISEEGHITERFTRAVEQLGNQDMAIRLGGIYALERIARDSPKDHWTVMEVLTTYVRENRPVKEKTTEETKNEEPACKLPTNIQTILTVIGRREPGREFDHQHLDLSYCDLAGARLQGSPPRRSRLLACPSRRSQPMESPPR